MTATPNPALQRTAALAFNYRSAALIRPAQSRAVLPAMKPGTARAFASRRRAHSRAPGPESLSLGSLGRMRTLLLQTLVWATLISAWPCLLHAHEDTLIQLKGTTLVGLPKDYAPAELDMKAFRLRIGKRQMTFSPYLKNFFAQPHDLRISASWYHDSAILPPYILLHIQPKKKDFSYDLLLNLRTLEVIELSVVLQTSDSTKWDLPIGLRDDWKKDIKESIQKLK